MSAFRPRDQVIVDYPGHVTHEHRGAVTKGMTRLKFGYTMIGPLYGVKMMSGKARGNEFWLPPEKLRLA